MTEHKIPAVGSKAAVFHGSALHTSGNLYKKDLMKTKAGRIVSKKKHLLGKKSIKHLRALGYIAKKGKFTLFRKSMAKSTKRRSTKKRTTRKRRGGAAGVPMATSGTGLAAGSHSK